MPLLPPLQFRNRESPKRREDETQQVAADTVHESSKLSQLSHGDFVRVLPVFSARDAEVRTYPTLKKRRTG